MKELCSRCNCYATVEIWCDRHYEQSLREWSCYACGEVNGGSVNRFRKKCGFCGHKAVTADEYMASLFKGARVLLV